MEPDKRCGFYPLTSAAVFLTCTHGIDEQSVGALGLFFCFVYIFFYFLIWAHFLLEEEVYQW